MILGDHRPREDTIDNGDALERECSELIVSLATNGVSMTYTTSRPMIRISKQITENII